MIMYCFHNNNPINFTIMKARMIDLKFAFRSMIDRRGFDRSDWSFSRIVWPLLSWSSLAQILAWHQLIVSWTHQEQTSVTTSLIVAWWRHIWRHRSVSTLTQVMACCLMAPRHYLNNVDLSSRRSSDIYLRAILQKISQPPTIEISLKITYLKFYSNIPGVNEWTHCPLRDGAVISNI